MAELRLEDLWAIAQGIFFFFGSLLLLRMLYVLWPQIRLVCRAFFTRHFNRDWWQDFLIWLADQGGEEESTNIMSREQSGSARFRTGTEGGSEGWFQPQQNQSNPADRAITIEDVRTFLLDNNLSDQEAVDIFTLAKRTTGPIMSANKIRDAVGGSDAEIKARVRKWRGGVEKAPPAKPSPAVSPIAGRPLPAHASFHSDNPELEYQAPD